jgi:hypothetical protein
MLDEHKEPFISIAASSTNQAIAYIPLSKVLRVVQNPLNAQALTLVVEERVNEARQ